MKIETPFTKMMNIQYPIIGAPMFLVSNEDIVVAISEAGGIGTVPSLNFRPPEAFFSALQNIKQRTKKPIGVNIIVNKSNQRAQSDLKMALDQGVELFITSLGSPKEVIKLAHQNNAKVICDVTNLEHALKVQDMGADGVIAVGTGAGGHAGPISPLVLVSWLQKKLHIPVIAAGGIANGATMAAMITLGASAVSIGTRFIASTEAQVNPEYKKAILKATPEDIVMTTRLSGTPASVIRTPYIVQTGLELPFYLRFFKNKSWAKKYAVPLIHFLGSKSLEQAAQNPTWKTVWSAGQSVGLIDEIKPCRQIIEDLVSEYNDCITQAPRLTSI